MVTLTYGHGKHHVPLQSPRACRCPHENRTQSSTHDVSDDHVSSEWPHAEDFGKAEIRELGQEEAWREKVEH